MDCRVASLLAMTKERGDPSSRRHCEEAEGRRGNPEAPSEALDCFAALALTGVGLNWTHSHALGSFALKPESGTGDLWKISCSS
jgi:hypothetical protein